MTRPVLRAVVPLWVALAAVLAPPVAHAATPEPTVWLCHPAMSSDPCRGSQQTTIQQADGTSTVENPTVPADPPIDCFYVYPTVSNQVGPNATRTADPEVKAIAQYQASRFSQQCRVFAPIYRQLTLLSIFDGGFTDASRQIAYDDVLSAWRDYLAHDNHGRGVVLIGHSQGSGVLRRLIREQIDPDPAARRLLVSALLMGGNVTVRTGSDRGGDFQNIPLCTADGQIGCVVAYSTFEDDPPSDARFGRPPTGTDRLTGLPARTDIEIACTNPASLGANTQAPLHSFIPSALFPPGLILVGILQLYGGPPPSAATPWVQPADRYTGRCEHINGAHVLKVRPIGASRHLNAAPDATWGLHLVDVNGALGDLQEVVARQTQTFLAPPAERAVQVRLQPAPALGHDRRGRRCVATSARFVVRGGDAGKIARVDFGLRGARLARDRTAPFAVRVPRSRLRAAGTTVLRARVVLRDGRVRTVTTAMRRCPRG